MVSNFDIVLRLLLASFLGGLIGVEREANNRPAGLRTHILVTLGSTLIMLVSIDGHGTLETREPFRLASQVVSGIGFLGAGTIMRTGNNINGLTTAASLWVSAGIGLAVGTGYYLGAIVTSGVVLVTLMSLGVLEKRFFEKKFKTIEIIGENRPGIIGDIGSILGSMGISIKDISVINSDFAEEGTMEVHFIVKLPNVFNIYQLKDELGPIKGIDSIIFEGGTILESNK